MTKKKQGPMPLKSKYKGVMITINEFILLPECELGRVSVADKLRSGMTFSKIIKAGNKTARTRKQHPYRFGFICVDKFSKLPECTIGKNSVHSRLRAGKTLDEIVKDIASLKPIKRRGRNKPRKSKPTFTKVKEQPKPRKVKLVDVERERIKAIMAVPINEKTQSAYYMPKSSLGPGEQTATRLSDNGWQGKP